MSFSSSIHCRYHESFQAFPKVVIEEILKKLNLVIEKFEEDWEGLRWNAIKEIEENIIEHLLKYQKESSEVFQLEKSP